MAKKKRHQKKTNKNLRGGSGSGSGSGSGLIQYEELAEKIHNRNVYESKKKRSAEQNSLRRRQTALRKATLKAKERERMLGIENEIKKKKDFRATRNKLNSELKKWELEEAKKNNTPNPFSTRQIKKASMRNSMRFGNPFKPRNITRKRSGSGLKALLEPNNSKQSGLKTLLQTNNSKRANAVAKLEFATLIAHEAAVKAERAAAKAERAAAEAAAAEESGEENMRSPSDNMSSMYMFDFE